MREPRRYEIPKLLFFELQQNFCPCAAVSRLQSGQFVLESPNLGIKNAENSDRKPECSPPMLVLTGQVTENFLTDGSGCALFGKSPFSAFLRVQRDEEEPGSQTAFVTRANIR